MVVEGDTIAITGPEAYPSGLPFLKVEGQQGRIRVQKGHFLTGTIQRGVEGSIDQDGRTIKVRLEATEVRGTAFSQVGVYAYDAWITNLQPGTYRLIIRHEGEYYQKEGEQASVFEEQVRVE